MNRCLFAAPCWKINEGPELFVRDEFILNVFLQSMHTQSLDV